MDKDIPMYSNDILPNSKNVITTTSEQLNKRLQKDLI